jgi:hypothetical protein
VNPLRHFFKVCWGLICPKRPSAPIGFCYHCRKAIYTTYSNHSETCETYQKWLGQKGY